MLTALIHKCYVLVYTLEAENIFKHSPIKITTSGKRHLGAAIGSIEFRTSYMDEKVDEWCEKIKSLSQIAKSQPQTAYAAYVHGEQHKYTYFLRTLNNIADILTPLDSIISDEFIPASFDSNISSNEREILSLPIKEGGMGLLVQGEMADQSYHTSRKVTTPLKKKIIEQSLELPDQSDVKQAKLNALTSLKAITNEKSCQTKQRDGKKS